MHTAIFKQESHFDFSPTLQLTRDFFVSSIFKALMT